ncbi:hypothetical protein Gotri_002538, partial [Gossypium trilobum]|nr:hypothetical protein [Gossypium trilobum]
APGVRYSGGLTTDDPHYWGCNPCDVGNPQPSDGLTILCGYLDLVIILLRGKMEEDLANLNISEEEEAPLWGQGNVDVIEEGYRLCLVGRVLTDSVVHFLSTRNTLADLWHTLGGVAISDIEEKSYLFRFYYEIDLKRVSEGMPWTFNRHLIIFLPTCR